MNAKQNAQSCDQLVSLACCPPLSPLVCVMKTGVKLEVVSNIAIVFTCCGLDYALVWIVPMTQLTLGMLAGWVCDYGLWSPFAGLWPSNCHVTPQLDS